MGCAGEAVAASFLCDHYRDQSVASPWFSEFLEHPGEPPEHAAPFGFLVPQRSPAVAPQAAWGAQHLFQPSISSLDALCKRFDISLESRTFHGALLDSQLLAAACGMADQRLRALGHADDLLDQVRALLAASLPGRTSLTQLAESLDMSRRSLQRRLAEAGTSYRQLVEAARL